MARLVESVYAHSPAWGQWLLLNAYGLGVRARHARMAGVLAALRETETWERERQVEFVRGRLRAVLTHAVEHVPRYRELRSLALGLRDPSCDPLEVLQEFPETTRGEILAAPDRYRSSRFSSGKLVKTQTSGTTGTPFATVMSSQDKLASDALWWRRTVWAGYEDGDWIARLVGDPAVPLRDRGARPPVRFSWPDRRIYLSSYHLTPQSVGQIWEVLAQRRPAFLMGYPSTLHYLTSLGHVGSTRSWRPKAILYSSEPLYPHQREAIQRYFDAPIRGLYGCAERVVSASECEHGNLHLGLVDGYVEGQFGSAGSDGLVTGLQNFAMPLIRYRTGDQLTCVPDRICDCGRTLPVLEPVVTKEEDNVVTPSGRFVSPSVITWAFKGLDGIRRSQVVQEGRAQVSVLVDADAEVSRRVGPVLKERLERIFFHEIEVQVVAATDIPISRTGKTRFVVNRVLPEMPKEVVA